MLIYIIEIIFTCYTFMLVVRVLGSWFPSFSNSSFSRFIAAYTDPYLNLFRRFIPRLGLFDISPMIAFFSLQIFQSLILYLIK